MNNSQIETINKTQESFYNGDLNKTRHRLMRLPLQLHRSWIDSTLSNCETHCPEKKGNFYRLLTNDCCKTRHGMLDPDMLEYCCPLDNAQNDSPSNSSSLGVFDILPLEILQSILIEELDLGTLILLQSTSTSFRRAIDELPQYRVIDSHAPSSIRAALSLEVASAYSCKKLYDTLCTEECSFCGNFSAFLYVLSCQRTCYQCFTTKYRFLPMRRERSKFFWSITSKDLETGQIPVARSLPGRYQNLAPTLQRSRLPLVDFDTGLCSHYLYMAMWKASLRTQRRWNNWERKALAMADDPHQNLDRLPPLPPYVARDDGKIAHANRFMCVIPFPWLDRCRGMVEWGVVCNGCKIQYGTTQAMLHEDFKKALAAQRAFYSKNGYLAHFLNCSKAQQIMRESYATKIEGGTQLYPYDSPICDISGNLSDREFYPDPYKMNLTPVERGKKRWDKLKPVQRRKRSTTGKGLISREGSDTSTLSE
ncbi:hypothetical protein N431DRAFT_468919 [Stipitochalara longipes BDJ]|nr:hypothetical protein N431DRAFT_468919 [Stipitochalara longipes BDJ]